jgi:hypothetical protein
LLKAKVPISNIKHLIPVLVGGASLPDESTMNEYITVVHESELEALALRIADKDYAVIFDGAGWMGECGGIVLAFWEGWTLMHACVDVTLFKKTLNGEEWAGHVLDVLYTKLKADPRRHLMSTPRDRCATNGVAVDILRGICRNFMDAECFSHTTSHVGENVMTPVLETFLSCFSTMMSESHGARAVWIAKCPGTIVTYSKTRWYSAVEMALKNETEFIKYMHWFLAQLTAQGLSPALTRKLETIVRVPTKFAELHHQLCLNRDVCKVLMDVCYTLECDAPIACHVYDIIMTMKEVLFRDVKELTHCEAFAQSAGVVPHVGGTAAGWRNITNQCLEPAREYYTSVVAGDLGYAIEFFKACRVFNPFTMRQHFKSAADLAGFKQHPAFAVGGIHHDLYLGMIEQLPAYRELVKNKRGGRTVKDGQDPCVFFRLNRNSIPAYAEAFKVANLERPSSAAVERLFSYLRRQFNSQQTSMCHDYIEGSMLLAYNYRDSCPKKCVCGVQGMWLSGGPIG